MAKKPKRYIVMFILCMLYVALVLVLGYKGFIPWPLVIASGLPDGAALYFAIISLQKEQLLEEKNTALSETILAYLEREQETVKWD